MKVAMLNREPLPQGGVKARMRFSLCMITQDREEMLQESVAAIEAQTYRNWELIIKDNGQRSAEATLPKDPRIRYSYAPEFNYAVNLNRAFSEARGEVIGFQGDDDWMRPDALQSVNEAIGEAKWLYGQILFSECKLTMGIPWDYAAHQRNNIVPSPATFWSGNAMREVGPFDVTLLAADWDYSLRLGSRWEPVFLPKILVDYRQHSGQATSRLSGQIAHDIEEIKARVVRGYYA